MVAYAAGVPLAKEPVKGRSKVTEEIPFFVHEPIPFEEFLSAVLEAGGDEVEAREMYSHPMIMFGIYSLPEALIRSGLVHININC